MQLTNRQISEARQQIQMLFGRYDLPATTRSALFYAMPKINDALQVIENQREFMRSEIMENGEKLSDEEKTRRFENFLDQESEVYLRIELPETIFGQFTVAELMPLIPFCK